MTRAVCRALWFTSEMTGIGLGRFAPWVLGGCIGFRPHREEKS
jgi:hypothetical protein